MKLAIICYFVMKWAFSIEEDYNALGDRCDHIDKMLGSLISKIKIS